jgi:amino acid adenylation domain-containing protein
MSKRKIETVYPLSPMQAGMLFHSLYAPESGVYFEQYSCTLHGDLDVLAFEQAWQRVVDRHTVLRTAFAWKSLDQMVQMVHQRVKLPLEQQDWRALSPPEQETHLKNFTQQERHRGFDLSRAPLMRLALLRTAEDAHYFVWSLHHALVDGWSLPLLMKEAFAFYEAFRQGQDLHLEPPHAYRDYITWLQRQDLAKAEIFWKQALAGFTAPTPLIVDRPLKNLAGQEERYEELEIRLPVETTATLQSLARRHHLTLSTLVQGAWAILLSRYSGERDVAFGATVSGRPAELPDVETMAGLFINTLPVRVQVPSDVPVVEWLQEFQAQLAEMRQYEYSSLVQIQDWSEVPKGTPLFESILVFENYPVDASPWEQDGSLRIENVRSIEQTNYPLTAISGPGETLPLKMSYDQRRFDADTIRRMLDHLATLLGGLASNPESCIASLPMLTHAERQQLLVAWNTTDMAYPASRCAHELFEAQANRTPGAIAVSFGKELYTYSELNRRANQLAHYLRRRGVGPETMVGLHVERSLEMVIGFLGILKAGAAYLPLDPTYPPERLAFMLEDAQVPILLTRQHVLEHLPDPLLPTPYSLILLDTDWETIAQESEENPRSGATLENTIYVIYTSGSTGRPKGVMVPHRALVNHAMAMIEAFGLGQSDRLLQFLSLSFDASAEEFFPTLLSGATLVVPPPDLELTGADFLRFCEQQEINILHLPAAFWHHWVDELAASDLSVKAPLKILLVGGESPAVDRLRVWSHLVAQPVRFLNAYGPTETTITTTFYETECDEDAIANLDRVPIGRPIANAQAYLLDREQWPVPVGVPGELYIGGVGVTQGYLNRPALTAERFIPDPFDGVPGARLYRTGDMVRYLPDGNIEFLGRVDHQVKVRGFRIELGEIETAVSKHPAVQHAVVLAREDEPGDKYLVAYVVPTKDTAPSAAELRSFLKQNLPAYMVPSIFVHLEALPLLPTGKVNRRALPPPEGTRPVPEATYVAPRTPVEEVLAELWARVLGVDRVGVCDDFFDLGGHSLLATQLVSRVRRAFQVEIPLRDLFEAPTVAGMAKHVEALLRAAAGLEAPPIEPVPREGDLPLSFAQQRLWFLDQLSPGNLFYNIPIAVRMRGHLNIDALERSLNEIVRRHESLRTTLKTIDGKPMPVIAPDLALPLPIDDLQQVPPTEREAEMHRRVQEEARQVFDLAHGPPLRARLLKLDEEDHVALLTMHHIVSDGWSMAVLVQELATLYAAFSQGRSSPLPELPVQYLDFAHWQREWLQGEVLERQLAYWKEQLSRQPLMLDLPTDRPRPAIQSWRGATEVFELPRELSESLQTLSREAGATLFMTLLAAFQTLLYHYTGQEDISVGTAIANRNRAEIEGLIGFFVNTLVMRADLSGQPSFQKLLKQVREVALGAYTHQDLPFEMLVEELQPERDLSHTPLFQAAFALQNAPMRTIELPGLTLTPLEADSGTAKFDLTLTMAEGPDGLRGTIEYNTDLFELATIQRMAGHFRTLLEGIVADPEQPISRLPLLMEAERHQLLVEWNNTETPYPADRCAHGLFEAQVAQRPQALAVTFDGHGLSYAELNSRANQLAHYLRKLGVGPEVLVGISTERSPEMVIGILGILKAGGAYLPLDPTYPPERLAFMLEDSQVPILLTQQHLVEHLPKPLLSTPYSLLLLDADWDAIAQEPTTNPSVPVTPNNLAYVIYTSGSTGRPKGTMLRHRGLASLTQAQRRAFRIREGSRVLQFSPFSFDASVWETFMALANGGTLCLARQEVLASGPDLLRLLREERITTVTLPPSVLTVLEPETLPDLEVAIAAGEKCTAEIVAQWAPGRRFFNAYGPTETTVCASMKLCETYTGDPTIGKPIENTRLYILDRHGQAVPIGVAGELCVGGVSVGRGYLARPAMTAEKFIPNPFPPACGGDRGGEFPPARGGDQGGEVGDRLYRTGDLVRYRPDGDIEFLGRIDHQVKVRGFRIELGEIEAVLRQHPEVQTGVVLARDDVASDTRLVAYVMTRDDAEPRIGELRRFLREKLPEYMVPSSFVMMDEFPVAPSGKVDRQALPAPEGVRPDLEREYVAPRNETEKQVAAICAELLGVDRVGVHDNFFELGGHSLLATQFISRLRSAFYVELPLRSLFENPTVADLARRVETLRETERQDMDKIVQMLKRINQLPEEQLKSLLAEKRTLVHGRMGSD